MLFDAGQGGGFGMGQMMSGPQGGGNRGPDEPGDPGYTGSAQAQPA